MAMGEKGFSTSGMTKTKFTSEPFPAGDYELKILGDTVETRKKEGDPKAFNYVSCAFEALGTGKDGQRNRRVYHRFFLRLKPSEKDGSVMVARADQLKGLDDAMGGQGINLPLITQHGEDIVSPMALVKFLKTHDGEVVKGHIRISKGGKDYPDKNEIDSFEEAEEAPAGNEDEEEVEETDEVEETEESEEEEAGEELEDTDEDEDEEDDLAAAAKKSKVKQGPAKKGGAKKAKR